MDINYTDMLSEKLDNFLANYGYNIDHGYVYTAIPYFRGNYHS